MMATDKPTESKITVEKRQNGRWCFVLNHRGVIYPAQGQFATMFEAQIAAQEAAKRLIKR
ncbi:hypothetical protein QO002_000673 [Pararhizobium capsulatum DSM 1112]|uniref:DUF1508 domain-containing protein n=1 Tax=Pararhizobium capsulatum DSM 1112 TaxID=1121113 RepID=A0ABU0BJV6_9HYPH|nr:hypothetical protein [Pararhizobium capsulatum]MDQ0318535.1 hypothetical protein [Pararhizobium capsulatum DSM 1112]